MGANLIDDRCRVVLLLLGRKPVVGVQVEASLILAAGLALPLAGLGDGRNQLGLSPSVARRLVERLAFRVEGMVPDRFLVRGIEDWLLEERAGLLRHRYGCSFFILVFVSVKARPLRQSCRRWRNPAIPARSSSSCCL